ncbi:peptidase M61 [Flavobacterium macrobrachii]|uniref:Peptidase M61 n=1 Tax=Flavobacterium macrobrachii TaxID=591204 RepID=A0ABS2CZX9_9FLAO|nr:peptidase M61 [Flavobacterium macrobrachii]MBM6500471.1 peptidase M61 [Flavobacterium macrobrachii]
MKKTVLSILFITAFSTGVFAQKKAINEEVKATIDLINVKEDKVLVTVLAPEFGKSEVIYQIPKTVPGTYSTDDYGKYIEGFKAFDKKGKELTVAKSDDNTWKISNAKSLAKITYLVNDTYDIETGRGFGKEEVFSPAGTNILAGTNFMLNNHGFVGYFNGKTDVKYTLNVAHPENLVGTTSLLDTDKSATNDVFTVSRYFELTDNPIMYSKPDFETFTVDGMEILFSVYSPNGVHSAKSLLPDLEKMMRAQKAFLGKVNSNKQYTVLLYLSDMEKNDAKGFGALEHHTSTTVVFPEAMPANMLGQQLIDVVSHEFFHILTPLCVHSKEIHYFDYNNPKMSKHLWMYEGVTEYFANLFQINQGLIDEDEFYQRMVGKIGNAAKMNDTMSFTVMSANVLEKPYKDQYLNVYEKGALIGMCIDIIIREKSNGERGILDMMQKLSAEYGAEKPFNDEELFDKIISITYPEVGAFIKTHIEGTTPINYDEFFAKVGVGKGKIQVPMNPFLKNETTPLVTINSATKEIIVRSDLEINELMKSLGMKGGDIILAVNDVNYNLDNIYEMIMSSQDWKEGDAVSMKIKRDGKEQTVAGKVKVTMAEVEGYQQIDASKTKLKEAWLKG